MCPGPSCTRGPHSLNVIEVKVLLRPADSDHCLVTSKASSCCTWLAGLAACFTEQS